MFLSTEGPWALQQLQSEPLSGHAAAGRDGDISVPVLFSNAVNHTGWNPAEWGRKAPNGHTQSWMTEWRGRKCGDALSDSFCAQLCVVVWNPSVRDGWSDFRITETAWIHQSMMLQNPGSHEEGGTRGKKALDISLPAFPLHTVGISSGPQPHVMSHCSALGQLQGVLPAAASCSAPRSCPLCTETTWAVIEAQWGSGPGMGPGTRACDLLSPCRRVLLPGSHFRTGRVVISSG